MKRCSVSFPKQQQPRTTAVYVAIPPFPLVYTEEPATTQQFAVFPRQLECRRHVIITRAQRLCRRSYAEEACAWSPRGEWRGHRILVLLPPRLLPVSDFWRFDWGQDDAQEGIRKKDAAELDLGSRIRTLAFLATSASTAVSAAQLLIRDFGFVRTW